MKFGLQRVSIWVNIQKKFQVPGRTVSEKSAMLISSYHRIFLENCATEKHESCLLGQLWNFEFLQVIIAFFSKSVRPRNMKFGLQRVSIWVNIQKKFQDYRSHNIGEKCDANL